jgi:hypothetical protein
MNKLRKLVLMTAALGALAVGGAAYAGDAPEGPGDQADGPSDGESPGS